MGFGAKHRNMNKTPLFVPISVRNTCDEAEVLMRQLGMPTSPQEIGLMAEDVADAFVCSRDIRVRYLLRSLVWDFGLPTRNCQC